MLVVAPCHRYCRQQVFRFQGRGLPLSKGEEEGTKTARRALQAQVQAVCRNRVTAGHRCYCPVMGWWCWA